MKIGISGALGRMGRTIGELLLEEKTLNITVALERNNHPSLGQDYGLLLSREPLQVSVTSSYEEIRNCDVVIDFSSPENTLSVVSACVSYHKPAVIGTTGFTREQLEKIKEASQTIPVVLSPNMSLGVNVLFYLVEEVARLLKDGFVAEVMEIHHAKKKDAPSGTAMQLKEILMKIYGTSEEQIRYGRKGITGERSKEEIGVHALRGGDVVGEHTVFFFGDGERIEITHKSSSRMIFARGAIFAAKWISGKPPGFYSMKEVLGMK